MKIHYIWIQGEDQIPDNYRKNIERTQKMYPEAKIKIWSEQDIGDLIYDKYPHLIDTVENLKHWILLVDIGRICILHAEGGMYVDTDVYIKRRIKFDHHKLFLVTNDYEKKSMYFGVNVRNWLIYAPKGHEFLKHYMDNLDMKRKFLHFWSYYVSATTGSLYISKLLEEYDQDYDTMLETKIYKRYVDNGYDSNWHTAYMDGRDFSIIVLIVIALIILILILIWIISQRKRNRLVRLL